MKICILLWFLNIIMFLSLYLGFFHYWFYIFWVMFETLGIKVCITVRLYLIYPSEQMTMPFTITNWMILMHHPWCVIREYFYLTMHANHFLEMFYFILNPYNLTHLFILYVNSWVFCLVNAIEYVAKSFLLFHLKNIWILLRINWAIITFYLLMVSSAS